MKEENDNNIYFKNKKRRAAIIFLALLLPAFFLYLKIGQNYAEIFTPLRLEEKLLKNEGGEALLYYGEFKTSDLKNDNDPDESVGASIGYADKAIIKNEIAADNTRKELPALLEIPKTGVSAKIQQVGLNSKNEMDVPSNDRDVAWYNLGPKPGETGSAVIAGHLDNRFGKPAVFWNLDKLEMGDYIYVIDGNNNKKGFQIVSTAKYETGSAPMEKIFGASDGAFLNLITCGGVWDKTMNNYTERLVVYTKLAL